jgi:septal ring-binding cell division protein DamX
VKPDHYLTLVITGVFALLTGCASEQPKHVIPGHASTTKHNQDSASIWHCEGNQNEQWLCRDLADPNQKIISSPVASTPVPSIRIPSTSMPSTPIDSTPIASKPMPDSQRISSEAKVVPITRPATEVRKTPETITDQPKTPNNPMNTYPSDYYVVQLIAARSEETIKNYLHRHPQISPQQINVILNGQAWRILILGAFPNTQLAQSAINAIDPPLGSPPWIRPIKTLQQAGSY